MTRSLVNSSFETICLHAGRTDGDGQPIVTPIVQSSTFTRLGVDSKAEHAYSRVSNPTVSALENALGALENAPPAVCFSTGLAAETALFIALLKQGDHVICGRAVYGGTTRLLEQILAPLGISVSLVDTTDVEAVRSAATPFTKLIFIETPANPTLEVTDVRAISEIASKCGAILAVDNTFLTAVAQQPLELGADVSVYSTTKYIDGHSTSLGGAIVTRDGSLLDRLRFIRKCLGNIQTPFNAFLTLQGLKTLPLRIRRQSESAGRIVEWLREHSNVERVYYPGIASAQQFAIAQNQHLDEIHGAVVSFELAGGTPVAHAFLRSLKLCTLCEHVGSVETLITHPASMTHADVKPEQRAAVGITDGLVRLSVGLENPEDIIDDLSQAIDVAVCINRTKREEVQPCEVLV